MNEQYTRAPHQSSRSREGSPPNAALLIDFDNVTMAIRSNLGQELRNLMSSDIIRGKVSVQRAYADWRRYPQYIVPLSEASIDLIFAPAYGSSKKNATDIRLAIDAMELVFTRPEIGTYILLSGDSDFSSLVLKLKEFGKYVIGVGLQESSSDLLVQNCDEYYSYDSISGLMSAEDMETDRHDPWELVEKAVGRMEDRGDVMRSDRLKQVMLEIDGSFDEKDLGFNKFNRFLTEASSRGLVKLQKKGDGQYEVGSSGRAREESAGSGQEEPPSGAEEPSRAEARSGDGRKSRSRAGSSGGGGREDRRSGGGRPERKQTGGTASGAPSIEVDSLREAYGLLQDVVGELSSGGQPVRDSEVKREMLRRDENFDEAEFGFRKFSRFLRQAYDEEVVELTTDEEGNFHVSLVGDGAGPRTAAPVEREEEAGPQPEAAEKEPEPSAPEPPEEETAAEPVAEASSSEPAGEPAREPEEGPETAEKPSGAGRRRRGVGRFGRTSRGGGKKAGGGDTDLPGPVDGGPSGDGDAEGPGQESRTGGSATTGQRASRGSRGRRGLGRFRRGKSAGEAEEDGADEGEGRPIGPVDEGEPSGDGDVPGASGGEEAEALEDVSETPSATAASGPEETAGRPDAGEDPVEYMVRNYPGVGQKTAEALVEAFGGSVFDVIDGEPERLSEVLPEHRARAVVDARQSERAEQAP